MNYKKKYCDREFHELMMKEVLTSISKAVNSLSTEIILERISSSDEFIDREIDILKGTVDSYIESMREASKEYINRWYFSACLKKPNQDEESR